MGQMQQDKKNYFNVLMTVLCGGTNFNHCPLGKIHGVQPYQRYFSKVLFISTFSISKK